MALPSLSLQRIPFSFRSLCKAGAVELVVLSPIKIVCLLPNVPSIEAVLMANATNILSQTFSYVVCFIGIYGFNFTKGG